MEAEVSRGVTGEHRSLSRPEGEETSGHATQGEESPDVLAERTETGATTTTPGTPLEASEPTKIVRASMRIPIDFAALSKDEANQLRRALYDASRLTVTVLNLLQRQLTAADTASLDAFLLKNGRMPKSAQEWPRPELAAKKGGLNLYQMGRSGAPDLGTGVVSLLARKVSGKWASERFDTFIKQTRSPPHYKIGHALPCRRQETTIKKNRLTVSLFSGSYEGPHRYEIPLRAHDTAQRTILEKVSTGEWKYGDVLIEQDRKRPGRWYIRIPYTRLVEPKKDGIVAALNRGIRNFLVMVVPSGDRLIYEGTDIEAYLKQIQSRRIHYQRQIKFSSRKGHGRKRALKPIDKLADKATNWRATRNQTIARSAVNWLRDRGVTTLVMEDLSGIRSGEPERMEGGERVWKRVQEWPFFDLGQRIKNCAEEYGITVIEEPAEYISQQDPKCGNIDPANRDLRYWKLRCQACGNVEDLDVAAAKNLLQRYLASVEVAKEGGSNGSGQLGDGPGPKSGGARKRKKK